jgi:kinesin family protein 11
MQSNIAASSRLDEVLREERDQAAADRQNLLSQITMLVTVQGEAQNARLTSKISEVQKNVVASKESFEASQAQYSKGMDTWNGNEDKLAEEILRSRETLKSKLKEDWVAANKHNSSLQMTTKSVHAETVRIVNEQMKGIETKMRALDDFVTHARSHNSQYHDSHESSLTNLSKTVRSSYSNISTHFTSTYERVRDLGTEMSTQTASLQETLTPLDSILRRPLTQLREDISKTTIHEYEPTGETPQKIQYSYPTELPRTAAHDTLLASLRRPAGDRSPSKSMVSMVPVIFNDDPQSSSHPPLRLFSASVGPGSSRPKSRSPSEETEQRPTTSSGLREVDVNVNVNSLSMNGSSPMDGVVTQIPSFKKSLSSGAGKLPVLNGGKKKSVVNIEGRENVNVGALLAQQSTGRRRSPRTAQ